MAMALLRSSLQDAVRLRRTRIFGVFKRVQVISVPSTLPQDRECPVAQWTLDEITASLLDILYTDSISCSRIWRSLQGVAMWLWSPINVNTG